MKKIEYLTASLPYELKVKILCGDGVFDTTTTLTVGNLYELGESRMKPIVRPLSDLTKPITQANYNGGEPFVPMVELAKIKGIVEESRFDRLYVKTYPKEPEYFECLERTASPEDHLCIAIYLPKITECEYWIVEQLIKWHFWPNMPEGEEVVWVTSEFNPYE